MCHVVCRPDLALGMLDGICYDPFICQLSTDSVDLGLLRAAVRLNPPPSQKWKFGTDLRNWRWPATPPRGLHQVVRFPNVTAFVDAAICEEPGGLSVGCSLCGVTHPPHQAALFVDIAGLGLGKIGRITAL